MKRRPFLQLLPAAGAGAAFARNDAPAQETPPFRTIYSNDTTNILSCRIPWRKGKSDFTDEDLAHSIREAKGADAHFLQPGLGWIPWWQSQIYSPREHFIEFLEKEHGRKSLRPVDRYLLGGGDMLEVLVKTCAEIGVAPFLSCRLNDGHHVRNLAEALKKTRPSSNMARHYWENYVRYRLGPDSHDWDQGVFDWAIFEVREYKFALIEEACAHYDLAGLELDFLRHWNRFNEKTPLAERALITTGFVRQVREMLDRTAAARGLPRRCLCVRVPAKAGVRPDQGIDLAALVEAGVDMVNLSWSYFTVQDDSVRLAREEIGDGRVAIYAEMTHCTMTGKATDGSGTQPFLRTTDQQFYTTARLVREQGARGVSLFNFPYYRYHTTDTIGPFHEPPFHVIPRLKDDAFLAEQAQWYFLSSARNDPVIAGHPLPAIISREAPVALPLEMAPAARHRNDGVFRLRSDEDIRDRGIEVSFNGTLLEETVFVEKPLPHSYENTWLGKPEEFRCYRFPAALARGGANRIEIVVTKGIRVRLRYLDVTLPKS